MCKLHFSFSKSLVTTTALAFISTSCLSSVAFAMDPKEDNEISNFKRKVETAVPPKDSTDADSQLENIPTVINSILVFLDPKSLLEMGTTKKVFHNLCNNPFLWDALFQRNLYPSISLTTIELKSPSGYYGLTHVLQEVLLPSAIRLKSEFKISKNKAWWEGMISQAFPNESAQGNYLRGFVYEATGLKQEAFDAYEIAADAGNKKAQYRVNEALSKGQLGQAARPELEQLQFEEPDPLAIVYHFGLSGQFDELKARAAGGDQEAQQRIIQDLAKGQLGQDERPEQVRFEELKAHADSGDRYAKYYMSDVLYQGTLGLDARPEQVRFEELKKLTIQGNIYARQRVNQALYEGTVGQNERSGQERFQELQNQSTAGAFGDKNAREYMIRALHHGDLDQNTRPEQERYEEIIRNIKISLDEGCTNYFRDLLPKAFSPTLSYFIFPLLKSLREGK